MYLVVLNMSSMYIDLTLLQHVHINCAENMVSELSHKRPEQDRNQRIEMQNDRETKLTTKGIQTTRDAKKQLQRDKK